MSRLQPFPPTYTIGLSRAESHEADLGNDGHPEQEAVAGILTK